MKVDGVSSFGRNVPVKIPPKVKAKNDTPIITEDKVDIEGKAPTSLSPLKSTSSKETPAISLEKIDTPIEVLASPLGDPSLISILGDAILYKKNLAISGKIAHGGGEYPVSLSLSKRSEPKEEEDMGYIASSRDVPKGDYTLSGKVGNMDVNIHCYTSGLSMYLEGQMGENNIEVKNSYSLFTGKITTKGNVGKIKVDLTTKGENPTITKGEIGGEEFYEKVEKDGDTTYAEGTLGNISLNGVSKKVDNTFNIESNVSGIKINYTVKESYRHWFFAT